MSVWSLACQQSVLQRYHSEKHLSEFYPQDGSESQLALKWRHCTCSGCWVFRHQYFACSDACEEYRTELFRDHFTTNLVDVVRRWNNLSKLFISWRIYSSKSEGVPFTDSKITPGSMTDTYISHTAWCDFWISKRDTFALAAINTPTDEQFWQIIS